MTWVEFLGEWALRSAVLILAGALLLWALRVKDASVRLAGWTAMLFGSLAIPAMTAALPKMPLVVMRAAVSAKPPVPVKEVPPLPPISDADVPIQAVSPPFDWVRVALIVYALIAGALLLRIGTGLVLIITLRRGSRPAGLASDGIEIRESELLRSPVTLGIVRPSILLPADWRQWEEIKLNAVLAHERSHIRRYDPAVQLLSAIHRALLWFTPTSWFLHQRLVRVAEEASDDAVVASTCDRATYAKVLLEFIKVRSKHSLGVPMARYGRPDGRIDRILDGTSLSRGMTRWGVVGILAFGLPLAYLVAAAGPAGKPRSSPEPEVADAAAQAPIPEPAPQGDAGYLVGLGSVTPSTVTIKPRVDGQLISVNFKEGELVHAGQVLATIDSQRYQLQFDLAQGQLARDQAQLADAMLAMKRAPKEERMSQAATLMQLEGTVKIDQANVDNAKLELEYTQLISPITGVAGLRIVDPGNIVHAADEKGIVVINQLQPIAVLFTVAEYRVPELISRIRDGATLPVEAWDRTLSKKFGTGRLTGFDNQIDQETGVLKFKAEFQNKDGALFPNQFVNIRLFLSK